MLRTKAKWYQGMVGRENAQLENGNSNRKKDKRAQIRTCSYLAKEGSKNRNKSIRMPQ